MLTLTHLEGKEPGFQLGHWSFHDFTCPNLKRQRLKKSAPTSAANFTGSVSGSEGSYAGFNVLLPLSCFIIFLHGTPHFILLWFCKLLSLTYKDARLLQSCPTLQPHGLQPARLLCPWDSPGKNTGVGSHSLLQGIFPTQDRTPTSAGRFFTIWATRKAHTISADD